MIVAAARNLVLAARAAEHAPVLALQQRVAALRAWRIREGRFFGVVGCFMWVPMIVWAFGVLGVDIVAARPWFVALNLFVSVACLCIYLAVSRVRKTPEDPAVRQARERLDEIARFMDGDAVGREHEQPDH
jgi:cobalamin biosynthesis protein CobD/CbiB